MFLLPCSQEPATGSYPKPRKSNPHPHVLSLFNALLLGPAGSVFSSGFKLTRYEHFSSPHTRHMPRPSHTLWFYHPNCMWWRVHMMKLFVMQFSPASSYILPVKFKCSSYIPKCNLWTQRANLKIQPDKVHSNSWVIAIKPIFLAVNMFSLHICINYLHKSHTFQRSIIKRKCKTRFCQATPAAMLVVLTSKGVLYTTPLWVSTVS
jgi:hypothetical protein